MIGLYMVTANRLELFKNAIKTLCDSTNMQFTGLILDNNSEPDVSRQIKAISLDNGFEYQKSHKQLGMAEQSNRCIKYHLQNPEIEYIVHIHDDIIFKPNWLDNILNVMKYDYRVWCACPSYIQGGYEGISDFIISQEPDIHEKPHYVFDDSFFAGTIVFTRSCLECVGLFDEQFVDSAEDTDYYYRLLLAHRPQALVSDSKIYHIRSGGALSDPDLLKRIEEKYARSEKLIRKKWANIELDYKTQWVFRSANNPIDLPQPLW